MKKNYIKGIHGIEKFYGFIAPFTHEKQRYYNILPQKQADNFIKVGFKPDYANSLFYNEFGAFISNVNENNVDEYAQNNSRFYDEQINQGMDLAIGRPAPDMNGVIHENTYGLYCTNWKELLETQMSEDKGKGHL